MKGLCNCGKPARYSRFRDGEIIEESCTKHGRCPTYEELQEKLRIARGRLRKLQMAAEDVLNLKEGTDGYKQATLIIEEGSS